MRTAVLDVAHSAGFLQHKSCYRNQSVIVSLTEGSIPSSLTHGGVLTFKYSPISRGCPYYLEYRVFRAISSILPNTSLMYESDHKRSS